MNFLAPLMNLFSAGRQANNSAQERDVNVPEKVFISKDGPAYEYTFNPVFEGRIEALMQSFYSESNLIPLYYCLPEVASAVNEIAARVADATWQLRKESNDEVVYTDPDFNRLFTRPNPFQSIKEKVFQAVCYEILTGKQFDQINKPPTLPGFDLKNILSWNNLPAEQVTIHAKKGVDRYTIRSLEDVIEKYTIPHNNKERVFTPDTVMPIVNLSLFECNDITCTKSMLLGADKAIKNLLPVYEARGTIYIKRGALGFMVSKMTDNNGMVALTKTQKEQAIADFQQTYGVSRNKSPIGITALPLDFVRTSMSIQELQPFDETLADAVAIYRVLRIPRHLVPSKDSSTFANAEADMKAFYADVIIPWAKKYAEKYTSFFRLDTPPDGRLRRYVHADFSHVPVLQADKSKEAATDKTIGQVYKERFITGVCTLNDWRVAIGEKKIESPLYNLTILEMTPEQLEQVSTALKIGKNGTTTAQEDTGGTPTV